MSLLISSLLIIYAVNFIGTDCLFIGANSCIIKGATWNHSFVSAPRTYPSPHATVSSSGGGLRALNRTSTKGQSDDITNITTNCSTNCSSTNSGSSTIGDGDERGMDNGRYSRLGSEKRIKIPYIVEYPVDRVDSEPDLTREEVAKMILEELGFFSTNTTTAPSTITASNRAGVNRAAVSSSTPLTTTISSTTSGSSSKGSSGELAPTNCYSQMVVDSSYQPLKAVGSSGKDYLVKTSMVSRVTKFDPDPTQSLTALDEEESPVIGHQRVRWFPTCVSKSLRNLHYYLKSADIILDVRDGRIPYIPMDDYLFSIFEREFPNKPRITVFTHSDLLPKLGMAHWLAYYRRLFKGLTDRYNSGIKNGSERRVPMKAMFVNARDGLKEIIYLKKYIYRLTRRARERCARRGISRPIKVILLGMPNVGKSSLINRLLGRRVVKANNIPGQTRDFTITTTTASTTTCSNRAAVSSSTTTTTTATTTSTTKGSGAYKKKLVFIDTPGFVTPISKDLLRYYHSNSSPFTSANCASSTNGSKDGRNEIMLLYSCLNLLSQSACESDEALGVLLQQLARLARENPKYMELKRVLRRYPLFAGIFASKDGIDLHISHNLQRLSRWLFGDNLNSCCGKILADFRQGKLGHAMLQTPPTLSTITLSTTTCSNRAAVSTTTTSSSTTTGSSGPNDPKTTTRTTTIGTTTNTTTGTGTTTTGTATTVSGGVSDGVYEGW